MMKYLTESFVWRRVGLLYAWLSTSFLGRLYRAFAKAWCSSWVYGLFRRMLCSPSRVEESFLHHLGSRGNCALRRKGQGLIQGASRSFLVSGLGKGIRESTLLGALYAKGATTLLLLCFCFYAIIDYVLRDVLVIAGFSSVWDELLMVLSMVWIILRTVKSEKDLKSRMNPLDGFVLFYILTGTLLLILCSTWRMDIHVTGFRASIQYLLVFFLVTRLIRHDSDFMTMYKTLVLIATVLAAYGVLQFIIGVEVPEQWTDKAEQDVRTRVFAIFSNPNVLGGYMVLFTPMTIGMAYAQKDLKGKVFYWACGLCMCGACLFTMSRGSWVALALAAVLFALIVDRKLFGLLIMAGVLACFLPFVRSRIGYLFTAEFQESNQRGGRGVRWARAFSYVTEADAWATGLGYGMYGGAVAMQNQVNPHYVYTYVDNYYVKTIAENGLIGLSALLTMLSGLLWNGARACARNSRTEYKPLCAGMLVGLLGVLVQMYFECLWEEPYFMALYFVVAAMLIYAGFLRKKENESN